MLIALWKFFHYSQKRAESLKIHSLTGLDLPELKIANREILTGWLIRDV